MAEPEHCMTWPSFHVWSFLAAPLPYQGWMFVRYICSFQLRHGLCFLYVLALSPIKFRCTLSWANTYILRCSEKKNSDSPKGFQTDPKRLFSFETRQSKQHSWSSTTLLISPRRFIVRHKVFYSHAIEITKRKRNRLLENENERNPVLILRFPLFICSGIV